MNERLKKELEVIYPGNTIKIVISKDGGLSAWKGAAEIVKSGDMNRYSVRLQ